MFFPMFFLSAASEIFNFHVRLVFFRIFPRRKLELQSFIESLDARALQLEQRHRNRRSVQPPGPPSASAASVAATGFGGFGRVLMQEVESMKGEVA